MNITTTPLSGVAVIDLERKQDDRGFFARTFDVTEFAAHGLDTAVAEAGTTSDTYTVVKSTVEATETWALPPLTVLPVAGTVGAAPPVVAGAGPSRRVAVTLPSAVATRLM